MQSIELTLNKDGEKTECKMDLKTVMGSLDYMIEWRVEGIFLDSPI